MTKPDLDAILAFHEKPRRPSAGADTFHDLQYSHKCFKATEPWVARIKALVQELADLGVPQTAWQRPYVQGHVDRALCIHLLYLTHYTSRWRDLGAQDLCELTDNE